MPHRTQWYLGSADTGQTVYNARFDACVIVVSYYGAGDHLRVVI